MYTLLLVACRSISPSVGYMGLQITDDETTVVMSSSGALGTFNLATGVQTATYNYNDFKGSCGTGSQSMTVALS